MSDEPALLAAILAHPDEDTPRLIYADWLDENGRAERAEFIRIQCAPDADEAAEDRALELEARTQRGWLAGLPDFPNARWEFRRGFSEYLDADAALFLERYEAFARVPWLRFVSLYGMWNTHARDLCTRPWKSHWVELELQEAPEAIEDVFMYDATATAVALAKCPQVDQLRRLRLSLFTFTGAAEGVEALAALRARLGDRLVID